MVNSTGNPATCLLNQSIVITYVDKFRWYRRARSILDCNNSSSSGNRASCSCVDGSCSLRRHGHGKHKKQIHMWLTSKLTIWMIVKPYTHGTYGDINLTVQFVRIFRMIVFLTAARDEPAASAHQPALLLCHGLWSHSSAAERWKQAGIWANFYGWNKRWFFGPTCPPPIWTEDHTRGVMRWSNLRHFTTYRFEYIWI